MTGMQHVSMHRLCQFKRAMIISGKVAATSDGFGQYRSYHPVACAKVTTCNCLVCAAQ